MRKKNKKIQKNKKQPGKILLRVIRRRSRTFNYNIIGTGALSYVRATLVENKIIIIFEYTLKKKNNAIRFNFVLSYSGVFFFFLLFSSQRNRRLCHQTTL